MSSGKKTSEFYSARFFFVCVSHFAARTEDIELCGIELARASFKLILQKFLKTKFVRIKMIFLNRENQIWSLSLKIEFKNVMKTSDWSFVA